MRRMQGRRWKAKSQKGWSKSATDVCRPPSAWPRALNALGPSAMELAGRSSSVRSAAVRYIAIVGSRQRGDPENVRELVNSLPTDSVIVSGRATGPDRWAEEAAVARGLKTLIFPPDLTDARSQGVITRRYHARNQQIVDAADEVFAFVSPDRRGGTEDTIRRAERRGIPVHIR
jgi:hypothetical protein